MRTSIVTCAYPTTVVCTVCTQLLTCSGIVMCTYYYGGTYCLLTVAHMIWTCCQSTHSPRHAGALRVTTCEDIVLSEMTATVVGGLIVWFSTRNVVYALNFARNCIATASLNLISRQEHMRLSLPFQCWLQGRAQSRIYYKSMLSLLVWRTN